jgi:hypothetical protein
MHGLTRRLLMSPTVRRIAVVGGLLMLGAVAGWIILGRLGWHGFSEPPQVGEKADAIVQRLGPPHYDSRPSGDSDHDYQLGYTDGLGTRHHLHVKKEIVVDITYSSR